MKRFFLCVIMSKDTNIIFRQSEDYCFFILNLKNQIVFKSKANLNEKPHAC
jgi:hypothetical protein